MDSKLKFNVDAISYDSFRPTYCSEMFNKIIHYSGLDNTKKAIEVGIGTGQATTPILETGCYVTAVELGNELAGFSKKKFAGYDRFSIYNVPFEDYNGESNYYDLLYSGTAFHWIQEETGYKKAFDLLKSGGTLALFWSRPFPGKKGSRLFDEMQDVYIKYRPTSRKPALNNQQRYESRMKTIKKHGFVDMSFSLFHQERTLKAEDYVSLLNTYSYHRALPAETKELFEAEIISVINRYGNSINIYDTIDLYLARKP